MPGYPPFCRPDFFMKSALVVEHHEVASFCTCSSDGDISNMQTKVIAASIAAPPLCLLRLLYPLLNANGCLLSVYFFSECPLVSSCQACTPV